MSATNALPTARQLRYLRELAARTATTFAYPVTRAQASGEIARLRSLPSQRRERAAEQVPGYATAVDLSEEVFGYGASATWRASSPAPARPVPRKTDRARPAELARYTLSAGERVLAGERVDGCLRLTDRPCSGAGREYLVERELEGEEEAALRALLADYVAQAREFDEVPMASGAVRQLLGQGVDGV